MKHTAGTAAKAVGRTKSTITKAIASGKISAIKNNKGAWEIDASELKRVYPHSTNETVEMKHQKKHQVSEVTSIGDLVERDGLTYKKFTDVPFTGDVDEGLEQGNYKNGMQEGPWTHYHPNGQLKSKGEYKSGRQEGLWVRYHENGQLRSKGDYKNDTQEGLWVTHNKNGQLFIEANFKEGEQDGLLVQYYDNGKLWYKGHFKNGKQEGPWLWYSYDGIVEKNLTGTYKNGKKISD